MNLEGALAGIAGSPHPTQGVMGEIERRVASQIGAHEDAAVNNSINAANASLQREFAQQGIRWRVEDAKAAGLHPLAALGMQPAQASPSFQWIQGQDTSRAARANMTDVERTADIIQALSIEKLGLENDLLASQIARTRSETPPGPDYSPVAHEPVIPQRFKTEGIDPGVINDISYVLSPDGMSVSIAPSKDVKERLEDNPILEALWIVRNLAGPALFGNRLPEPTFPAPKGYLWQRTRAGFRAVKPNRGVRG